MLTWKYLVRYSLNEERRLCHNSVSELKIDQKVIRG